MRRMQINRNHMCVYEGGGYKEVEGVGGARLLFRRGWGVCTERRRQGVLWVPGGVENRDPLPKIEVSSQSV